jgi:hypothetical protein
MSVSPNTTDNTKDATTYATTADQRKALEQSEKKAAEKQPGSYKEKATDEKLVEIGPDLADNPIKGIDPAEDATQRV